MPGVGRPEDAFLMARFARGLDRPMCATASAMGARRMEIAGITCELRRAERGMRQNTGYWDSGAPRKGPVLRIGVDLSEPKIFGVKLPVCFTWWPILGLLWVAFTRTQTNPRLCLLVYSNAGYFDVNFAPCNATSCIVLFPNFCLISYRGLERNCWD